jgi:hypothetical protein
MRPRSDKRGIDLISDPAQHEGRQAGIRSNYSAFLNAKFFGTACAVRPFYRTFPRQIKN